MGGKDVVCVKQLKGSDLTQSDVQARLKKLADDRLSSSSQEDSAAGSGSAAGDGRLSQGLNVSTSLFFFLFFAHHIHVQYISPHRV